jgi:putative transposase
VTEGVGHVARSEDERGAGRAQAALIEVQTAQGKSLALACREAQVSEQSYSRWRKEYGGLQIDQARKMRELERENARLRRPVADLSLEEQVLAYVASGNV